MKPIRKTIKFIAAFLIVNTLYFTFLPAISYAQTAGPTAPEATSFEPIDTTDMVNLLTGDFTYNLPLLEVPGPAGGYPLGLSYHAGIMTNEEASWVGLGWTLNPGAITRDVNGYADDHKNALETNRFYWEGGEQHQIDIGGTLGVSGVVGVSAGLSLGHDTYQGFGAGGFVGVSAAIGGVDSGLGANATIGISPFGGAYASAGLSLGLPVGGANSAINVGLGLGVSTNFESVSAGGGAGASVSYGTRQDKDNLTIQGGSASLLGASISSKSNGFHSSISVGGASSHNSKAGKISTKSFSIALPVPFINLGYKYTRYWIDETTNTNLNGVFHYPTNSDGAFDRDNTAFDSYSLLDPSLPGGIVDNPDPDKLLGGSFPSYDSYHVNAQGVSGNMRPYIYQGYIARKHKYDDNGNKVYQVKNIELGRVNQKPRFRFIKEFSNTYQQDISNFFIHDYDTPFSGNQPYSYNQPYFNGQTEGHFISEHAGTKHIEYFTNAEILDNSSNGAKSKGLINTASTGFVRDSNEQIGAYKITNETGVTYHFALPAYTYDEFQYSENVTKEDGDTFNYIKKSEKYAHTWFLTAITGPDYVDINNNGLADSNDWGYWVEFEYGLWSDQYTWRNPGEGSHKDLDENFENFSEGTKEVYYLDAIKTQTHTALFIKDIRDDAKSGIKILRDIRTSGGEIIAEGVTAENKEGGYFPKYLTQDNRTGVFTTEQTKYYAKPVSSLKLKKIILTKNSVAQSLLPNKSAGNNYDQSVKYKLYNSDGSFNSENEVIQHQPDNVLDVHDITQALIDNSLRVIDFDSDNDGLVPNTTNSFSQNYLVSDTPSVDPTLYENNLKSKLTLNSVQFSGKKGVNLTPPMNFSYAKNPAYDKDAYDMWNMFKSDYIDTGNGNIDRIVTTNSAQDIDAWSLTEIETSIGSTIKIGYEPDTYNESTLTKNFGFLLDSEPVVSSQNNGDIELTINNSENLDQYLVTGDSIEVLLGYYEFLIGCSIICCPSVFKEKKVVENVSSNIITINSPELVEIINSRDTRENIANCVQTPFVLNTFAVGNIAIENINKCGGGIKVNNISVTNPVSNIISKTSYDYSNNGVSSGITSYEPTALDSYYMFREYEFAEEKFKKELHKQFSSLLSNSREAPAPGVMYEYVTTKNSVIKDGMETFSPSYSKYHFEVFKESMIGYEELFNDEYAVSGTIDGENITRRKKRGVSKKDYTARIGSLKSVTLYDNNDKPISSTVNHYLHDKATIDRITNNDLNIEDQFEANIDVYESDLDNEFFSQGVIEEAFADARIVREDDEPFDLFVSVMSKKEEFPSIQTGQTNINYKTGITTTSKNLAFDFYSGAVTKSLYSDGYGNNYISETVPAYRFSYNDVHEAFPGMGLAIDGGKNMLAQVATSFTYKVDNGADKNRLALVSGDVQLWKQFWSYRELSGNNHISTDQYTDAHPIWRKHKSYSFTGGAQFVGVTQVNLSDDGLYPYTSNDDPIGSFVGTLDNDGRWQQNSEITLYDRNSHALEAIDINGNYASTKMDINHEKIFATVANASYNEFAYSGAEEETVGGYFGGEVTYDGVIVSTDVHTGSNAVAVDYASTGTPGSTGFSESTQRGFIFKTDDITPGRIYRTSVWSLKDAGRIKYKINNGSTQTATQKPVRKAGDWHLLSADISTNASTASLEVWCESSEKPTVFDDFRIHPIDAPMTAYVYDEATDELTHILDNNNLYTEYEYDALGRLISTSKESFKYGVKKISQVDYNYGRKYYDDKDKIDPSFTNESHDMVNNFVSAFATDNSSLNGTTTYHWYWGDGTSSSTPHTSTSHQYTSSGQFDITLNVENSLYGSNHSQGQVTVYSGPYAFDISKFGPSTYDKCSGGNGGLSSSTVQFGVNINISNGQSQCPANDFTWKYNYNGSTTILQNPSFNLQNVALGTYTFFATATDQCGNTVTSGNSIPVTVIQSQNPCQTNNQN